MSPRETLGNAEAERSSIAVARSHHIVSVFAVAIVEWAPAVLHYRQLAY